MMRLTFSAALTIGLCLATAARAADGVVATYAGDGLTIRVTEWDEENGTVRGDLVRNGQPYPFTGRHAEVGSAEVVTGSFKAGDKGFDFVSRQEENDEVLRFTTGGKTYQLRPAKPAEAANPLADPPKPPVVVAGGPPAAVAPPIAANDAGVVRLKRHAFPDVTMGGVPAYTALMPADWTADGRVQWLNIGEVPFPQTLFSITTPQGGRIVYVPNRTFAYMNAPGLGRREGEPPPQDFPAWFAEALPKSNPKVSDVKMTSARREAKLEALSDDNDRQTNANTQGMRREIWLLNYDYDEAGVRRHDETIITFVAYAPFNGLNGFHTQNWAMFFTPFVGAPAASFDQQKAALYNVTATLRPTLKWFTLSQQIIAENSRQRTAANWDAIKRRGEMISQMHVTPADEQKYNAGLNSDENQRKRLNGIAETEDYKDLDGSRINLPIHGKYKWSDGQGNVVITNKYEKPGSAFQELQPTN